MQARNEDLSVVAVARSWEMLDGRGGLWGPTNAAPYDNREPSWAVKSNNRFFLDLECESLRPCAAVP